MAINVAENWSNIPERSSLQSARQQAHDFSQRTNSSTCHRYL
jgi:hypothetical protein